MKQVVVFAAAGGTVNDSYTSVESDANTWLREHTDTSLLASHTNMVANESWTEFALTLIIDIPEQEREKGGDTPGK